MIRPATILLVLSLVTGLASAQQHRHPGENVIYDYAQVLRAAPVYEIVRVRTPETRCESDSGGEGGDATGGTVAGAVVGGAIGNRVGKGDGRKASTIAGAVIGGAIGRRIDKNNGPPDTGCRTVEGRREERRLIGYDVEYQYKGEKYMSRMDNDPGNRVRIRVSVVPDENTVGYR